MRGLTPRQAVAILAAAGLAAAPGAAAQVFLTKPPYVPTPQSTVDRMLELARVGPDDFVIDLGSGDGRIVITAATKFGARGLGIEIEPDLVNLSEYYARRAGVADRARFVTEDLFVADLRPATVLTLYLFRELNVKLRPRLLEQLRPGARVVAHDWDLGDEWEPDLAETIPAPDKPVGIERTSRVYLWYVPAKVEGRWRLETPLAPGRTTLVLAQQFQKFAGELELDGARYPIAGGRARGTAVRFTVPAGSPLAGAYDGTVDGAQMRGVIRRDGAVAAPFTASRP
jgi:hypothetical protein